MQSSLKRVFFLAALTMGICVAPIFAQEYEINPYAGGLTMGSFNSNLDFKNPAIFGLRGAAYVSDHIMIEGNAGWLNQINFSGYNYRTSGILYEAATSYNLFHSGFHGVVPFAIFGAGGLTVKTHAGVNMDDHNQSVYVFPLSTPQATAGPIANTLGVLTVADNDTFFTVSYGGGLKGQRLWGPLGLRMDLRGRTIPGFYGSTINSFEATGGLLFSWGER
jgi:hypothetical protein